MAVKTLAVFYSDLSGQQIEFESPSLVFGLDGDSYEIDLTESEQIELREFLRPYVDAGRTVTDQGAAAGSAADAPSPKAVRAWAREQGIEVPGRGRIPAAVLSAFIARH
jgi:hypothetical protein